MTDPNRPRHLSWEEGGGDIFVALIIGQAKKKMRTVTHMERMLLAKKVMSPKQNEKRITSYTFKTSIFLKTSKTEVLQTPSAIEVNLCQGVEK